MSATGDFGPAPPGVNLSRNQNSIMMGGVVTLMILGTIALVLRIYVRVQITRSRFATDDFLIMGAMPFAYGAGAIALTSLKYGNGHHVQAVTTDGFVSIWKLLFSHVCIYAACVTCTKSSIMMFYHRIFSLRLSLYIMMSLIISYFIVVIVVACVACRPLSYFWLQYIPNNHVDGKCINTAKFFLGNGIGAVVIDFLILWVPIPIVWKLHMPRSQRMAVIGVLLLGGFVCVAGIVRLVVLDRNTKSKDPTWSIAPVFLWSCVEPFVGIVCACLPTLSPLFRRWWSTIVTGSSGKKSSSEGISKLYDGTSRSRRTHQSVIEHENSDEVELTGMQSSPKPGFSHETDQEGGILVKDEVTLSWD